MASQIDQTSAAEIPVEDRLEAERLIHAFAYHFDIGNPDGLENVLTEDATFEADRTDPVERATLPPHNMRGRVQIIATLKERREHWSEVQRKHCMTNFFVTHYDGVRLRASSYMIETHTPPGGPVTIGECGVYDDTMVKGVDGRWRISARRFSSDVVSKST